MRFLTPDRSPVVFRSYVRMLQGLAGAWRRLLFRTTFIGITGSLGKTVAKECLAGILSQDHSLGKTFASQSASHGVPLSVLRIRPWHDFAVLEVGAPRPGAMARSVSLIRPRAALVLAVLRNHSDRYGSLEEIAAEKRRLVEALPRDGLAVLNVDDELVRGMAASAPCRVFTYGSAPGCDLVVEEVRGTWPGRLGFRATHRGQTVEVSTRLVGRHQWSAAAGALAAAVALGTPLADAAAGLSRVDPHTARMEPVQLPGGALLLRDELGAVPASFDGAMETLATAVHAGRRIAVLGQLSDSGMKGGECAEHVARRAACASDAVVFIGRYASRSARVARESGMRPECVHAFKRWEDAAAYLRGELREGDLVLLKGRVTEHLARVFHAQIGTVKCRARHCRLTLLCDYCAALGFEPFRNPADESRAETR